MKLSSDDIQNMQSDAKYIPSPIVNDRLSSRFYMSTAMDIAYEFDFVILPAHILQGLFSFCQILKNEKLLLVLVDREWVFIYLEPLPEIDAAIRGSRPIKSFNREKLGQDFLFAYDEMKRTLAVCASKRVRLSRPIYLQSWRGLLFVISYNSTHSFSMRPSKPFRLRGVVSTFPPGIADQGSLFYM